MRRSVAAAFIGCSSSPMASTGKLWRSASILAAAAAAVAVVQAQAAERAAGQNQRTRISMRMLGAYTSCWLH
jgi:hypothetical protein